MMRKCIMVKIGAEENNRKLSKKRKLNEKLIGGRDL